MTAELVDRDSAVPLYRQLKRQVRELIEAGEFAPGSRVPSENELSARHSVSRVTARQALQELESEGWLVRIVGKGTFVAERPRVDRVPALTGFGENMRAIGREPSYRLMDVTRSTATPDEARRLDLTPLAEVYRISRLLLADGEAIATADSVIPATLLDRVGFVPSPQVLEGQSLYRLLEDEVGVKLFRALEEVEPGTASPEQAALLDIAPDDFLLLVTRVVFDQDGQSIELVNLAYVAARYHYQVELFHTPAVMARPEPGPAT